jgi:hypothetical protein
MKNIWKEIAKDHMDEDLFEGFEERIREDYPDVVVKCNMTNLIGGGVSTDGVFLSLETDINNAFDVAYRNHEKESGEHSGDLIIDFDNKLSIDHVIEGLILLRKEFDNKEDTNNENQN